MYLTGAVNDAVRPHLHTRQVGVINTPANGFPIDPRWVWAADNGCFGKGYPGDQAYLDWLNHRRGWGHTRLFATAPDVVGDHEATLERSRPMLPAIQARGWPAAFVAQDGATPNTTPWATFDWLFIGGTDQFKLGPDGAAMIEHATGLGKPVHMGRVNSAKRFRYAEHHGCTTADGTYLAFGPDTNMPRLKAWAIDATPLPLNHPGAPSGQETQPLTKEGTNRHE